MGVQPVLSLLMVLCGASAEGRVYASDARLNTDSRLLVYTREHPSSGVYCRSLDSNAERKLWPREEAASSAAGSFPCLSLSPAGNLVSVVEVIGEIPALRVITLTGEERLNIPNAGIYAWDPQGHYIAYTIGPISEKEGPLCVPEASFLIDIETKHTTQLPFTAAEFGWCPQPSRLYAFVWDPVGYVSYDLFTRKVEPLSIPSLNLTDDCALCFDSNPYYEPLTEVFRVEPYANLFDVPDSPLPKKVRDRLCARRWISSGLLLLIHSNYAMDRAFYLLSTEDGRLWRSPDAFVGCLSGGTAPVVVQYSTESDRFYEQPLNQLKTFDPEGIPSRGQ